MELTKVVGKEWVGEGVLEKILKENEANERK